MIQSYHSGINALVYLKMGNLIYKHCYWCNGIFKQQKESQGFCCLKCRQNFSENRKIHGGFACGDPAYHNNDTYKYVTKNLLEKYPLRSEEYRFKSNKLERRKEPTIERNGVYHTNKVSFNS